jgi:hypothetical protein
MKTLSHDVAFEKVPVERLLKCDSGFRFEFMEKTFATFGETLFQPLRAVTIGAGPGLGAIYIAAIFPVVSDFDAEQFEVFLPVRTFHLQGRGAEAGFHPVRCAVFVHSGMFQIVDVFVIGNGASAQRAVFYGFEESFVSAFFYPRFDEITHVSKERLKEKHASYEARFMTRLS